VVIEVRVDDVVRLRKPHPCGSFDWRVYRIGADIGLRCLKCDHRVMLTRGVFERRLKSFITIASTKVEEAETPSEKPDFN
jgi:hypothetical protein